MGVQNRDRLSVLAITDDHLEDERIIDVFANLMWQFHNVTLKIVID